MKNVIAQLIDDFNERNLPQPVPRDNRLSEIKGKADVVIGMRRAGKTWFCFQKTTELLSAGIPKEQILYLNFEDERLLGFDIHHFQTVLDLYNFFSTVPEHSVPEPPPNFARLQMTILNWRVSRSSADGTTSAHGDTAGVH